MCKARHRVSEETMEVGLACDGAQKVVPAHHLVYPHGVSAGQPYAGDADVPHQPHLDDLRRPQDVQPYESVTKP